MKGLKCPWCGSHMSSPSPSSLPPLPSRHGGLPRPPLRCLRHRAEEWRGGRQAASSSAPTRRSAGGVQGLRPLAARRSRRAAAVARTRDHRVACTRGRRDVVAERREAGRAETERQRRPRARTRRWRQGGAARGRRCWRRRRALLPPPSPDPGAGEPSSLSPSRRQSPAPSAVSPSPRLFWSGKGPAPSPIAGHRATPPPGAHDDRAGRRARVRMEHVTGRLSRRAGDRTAVRAHPAPSTCTRSSRGAQEAQQDGGLHVRSGGGGGEHEPDDDGEQRVAMAQRGAGQGTGWRRPRRRGGREDGEGDDM